MIRKWLFTFLLFPLLATAQSEIDYLNDLGYTLYERQQYDSALIVFAKELQLTKGNNPQGEARTLVNMGIIYLDKNDLDKAMEYFENSTVTAEKINDSIILASCYLSSGMVHERKASYLLAKQLYLKAAGIYTDLGDWDGLSSSYNSVGNIQNKLGEFTSALYYYQKSLDIWTELKDSFNHKADIAASLNNIGDLYKENKQYDKALTYLTKALFYKREIGNDRSTAHTLSALGEVYEFKGKSLLAMRYYKEAYKIREKVGDRVGIASSANLLASLYLASKNYNDAEHYLFQSRKIAEEDSIRGELLKNYDLSRKLYKYTNQFQLALQYDELYIQLDHLLLDEATVRALKEIEVKYETAENLEKNKRLAEELKKKEEISYLKTISIISLFLVIALILLAYYQKIKGKRKVESLMRELNHRVKNNMQVLSSLLNLQYEQLEDKSARIAIKETGNRVKAMAVVHRKLYLGKELSLVSVHHFIKELTNELRMSYGFDKEKLKINFDLDDLEILADKAIPLGLIMNEILSNSFKYAFTDISHPQLDLSLKKVNKGVIITIKDNGKGISADEQNKDSFGYKLIRMLCKQLHAKLEIKNVSGTRVIISIDNL
jgi:two-component sensor histidine kinase/tetratricopeptide (TPR) repeat protein